MAIRAPTSSNSSDSSSSTSTSSSSSNRSRSSEHTPANSDNEGSSASYEETALPPHDLAFEREESSDEFCDDPLSEEDNKEETPGVSLKVQLAAED